MGKCSDCGKKLDYFEAYGHIIDNKEFCEDCFNKREESKSKKREEENKNKTEKEKERIEKLKNPNEKELLFQIRGLLKYIAIILLLLLLYFWWR